MTTGDRPELKPVNVGADGIDIGSKMHMAAVGPGCTDTPVRAFGTFTQYLHDLADWFKACGVTSVAMESTGVYWILGSRPVGFLSSTGRGHSGQCAFTPRTCLGAKQMLAMPRGSASFMPTVCYAGVSVLMAEIATLRAYLRQRERLDV
ncbi:hypothetical protein NKJ73_31725 [Mesorhizobium sp. M0074]|uniref:hypothetical protein n=1 Tax=Mesorhizobium sp. M0074 TaxID=2956869 RepID=UPI00333DAEF9